MVKRNEFNENLDKRKGKYKGDRKYDMDFANPIVIKTVHKNLLYIAFVHTKEQKVDGDATLEEIKYLPCLSIV